jgi:hypothetical protein
MEIWRISFVIRLLQSPFSLRILLTKSNEQNPSWDVNSRSAYEEISYLLWNPMVHYSFHKSPVPIMSQIYPAHTLLPYSFRTHFNSILSFTHRSSKWYLLFRFFDQNFLSISHFPHACHMLISSFLIWSPYQYLVKQNNDASSYSVFSTRSLPLSYWFTEFNVNADINFDNFFHFLYLFWELLLWLSIFESYAHRKVDRQLIRRMHMVVHEVKHLNVKTKSSCTSLQM